MLVRRRDAGLDAIQAAKLECRIRYELGNRAYMSTRGVRIADCSFEDTLSETLSPRVTKLRRDISQTADFPEDRYVVSGVMPGGYAYCFPSTPSHGFVDKIGRPARAGAGTDIDWLEQNRAS